MRKKTFSKEQIGPGPAGRGAGDAGPGGLPEKGSVRAILLPVEEETWGWGSLSFDGCTHLKMS